MLLTRHQTSLGPRWVRDGKLLPAHFSLTSWLALPRRKALETIRKLTTELDADGRILAPIEREQEVWASGVTYLKSRNARKVESASSNVYDRVYRAQRPELFFKSAGWRVVDPGEAVGVREDSHWNVPEPELTLVVNSQGEIVGYTAGNDMSSRDIEGENPLYLPQAKVYDRSCSVGTGMVLLEDESQLANLAITLEISRGGNVAASGETNTDQMKRTPRELVEYLYRELVFPAGALLMTGTGIVPDEGFSLQGGDRVRISVGEVRLENLVEVN